MFVAFSSFFDWSDGILPDLDIGEAEPIRKGVKIPAGDFSPAQSLCNKVHADSSVPERVNKTMWP